MAAESRSTKIERIRKKLESSIEAGKFYEASQQAKTIYYRYKAQKKLQDAVTILYDSSLLFLNHDQLESGVDLARLMVASVKDSKTTVEANELGKLVNIIRSCRGDSVSRQDFIKECLGLTLTDFKYGHPLLHLAIAIKYWEERNFAEARHHFLFTRDGICVASFLVEYQVHCGFPSEVDLFVVQVILQFLCLDNSSTANAVFVSYTKNHPAIERQQWPFSYPLLNFIAFLLLAVEQKSTGQFNVLCQKYKPSLSSDPCYFEYLEKIGQVFFGKQPKEEPKTGIAGMLGGLMETILGAEETVDQAHLTTEDVD